MTETENLKEYEILVTETITRSTRIMANSEEEAKAIWKDKGCDAGISDWFVEDTEEELIDIEEIKEEDK